MLSILKAIGKWGVNVAFIVSIPIAHSEREMQKHLDNVNIERVNFLKRMDAQESDLKFVKDLLLEQNKQINFIYQRERERAKEEHKN